MVQKPKRVERQLVMRTSLVAARGLVLAILGLGAGSALGQNVTAFDPYNGVGLPGGAPAAKPGRIPYTPVEQAPPGGPAFNPWNPNDVQAGRNAIPPKAVTAMPRAQRAQPDVPVATYGGPYYGRGANLPPPPPDALHSRLTAFPEKGAPSTASRGRYAPPPSGAGQPVPLARTEAPPPPPVETPAPAAAATAPAPQPAPSQATPPPPTPTQAAPTPATPAEPAPQPTQTPAPAVATTTPAPALPAPAVTPPQSASVAPSAPPLAAEPEPTPPAPVPPTASVLFAMDSAEINEAARTELDRIAKGANARGLKQIELRAYAGGVDIVESRKVALARALAVRSYLIDQGVKARIEVGTFGPAAKGMGPPERVDLVAPGI
jgi:outer membrane protein OmpA-like peptidoglycan-associated protein